MKKILLIEDEKNLASFVKKGLQEEGFHVDVAYTGEKGLELLFHDQRTDLVVLDILLPNIDGFEVCKRIRSSSVEVPVLMLTALTTTENIVHGLNTGADDYLVKPFRFEELLARINALTRRIQTAEPKTTPHIITFEGLKVDDTSKRVERDDERIQLTATEYRLLLYLIRNVNRVLSREQILNNVWGINFELSTNVVDVYINYLRKKVDRKPYPRLIHTVVGMGYVLRKDER